MSACIFCGIVAGEIPATILYQDDQAIVFEDVNPKAPVHLLVIPKQHRVSLNQCLDEESLLGHLLGVAARLAKEKGIDESGYRTVINTNAEAGQTVFHLHLHLLGGRALGWPPG